MVARRLRPDSQAPPDGEDLRPRLDECTRELDELRERVRLLEERGARFLAAAAHAIVNPLTIAHSYLEILGTNLQDGLSGEQRTSIAAARDAVRRMRVLLDELLELASLETGAAAVRPEAVDCSELVQAVIASLEGSAEAAGVTVVRDLETDLPPAAADADRLEGALRRLLARAIRVTPSGGAVSIRIEAAEPGVVISVEDPGDALTAERRAEIFDPVVQLSGGPGERAQRLALAVAHRQVASCAGTLEVSAGTDSGSTFTIRLRRA